MKRVIFTTVQNNYEAIKMLELALKSFYAFNSGFDFKVYCLDNSKESFEEYFDKFNFENLEFINFKDGTKWNSYLEHLEKDELTDLERKNMYVSDPELYAFDTSVCISKLEIIDLLLEKYDLVIATDIDVVFISELTFIDEFIESGYFVGAFNELHFRTKTLNCGFCLFNKNSGYIPEIFDKAIYTLKNEDIRNNEHFVKTVKNTTYVFKFFEQSLLEYLVEDFYELNSYIINTCLLVDSFFEYFYKHFDNACIIHFSGKHYKPFTEKTSNNFLNKVLFYPLKTMYWLLFKMFDVDMKLNISTGEKFSKDQLERMSFFSKRINEKFSKSSHCSKKFLKATPHLKAFVKS